MHGRRTGGGGSDGWCLNVGVRQCMAGRASTPVPNDAARGGAKVAMSRSGTKTERSMQPRRRSATVTEAPIAAGTPPQAAAPWDAWDAPESPPSQP